MRFSTDLQAAFYACAMRYIENEVIAQKIASACMEVSSNLKAGKNIRDDFAMAALTGLLVKIDPDDSMNAYAEHAYKFADAMMEARK